MSVHKLDLSKWQYLSGPEQLNLNEQCDVRAKQAIYDENLHASPLGAIVHHVEYERVTINTGDRIRFSDHRNIAKDHFAHRSILLPAAFDRWIGQMCTTHCRFSTGISTLRCKKVYDIAGTNSRLHITTYHRFRFVPLV